MARQRKTDPLEAKLQQIETEMAALRAENEALKQKKANASSGRVEVNENNIRWYWKDSRFYVQSDYLRWADLIENVPAIKKAINQIQEKGR